MVVSATYVLLFQLYLRNCCAPNARTMSRSCAPVNVLPFMVSLFQLMISVSPTK